MSFTCVRRACPHPVQARWGEHMCHLYRTRADLLDATVPFFAAGLVHGERCIWIASDPMPAAEARHALRAVVPDLDERERRGQIEILDHHDWYLRQGELTPEAVIDGWLVREQAALRDGYAGLRISGNTSFVTQAQWAEFADYEARVHAAFHGRRIIALCSYSLARCGSDQIGQEGQQAARNCRDESVAPICLQTVKAAAAKSRRQNRRSNTAPPCPVRGREGSGVSLAA